MHQGYLAVCPALGLSVQGGTAEAARAALEAAIREEATGRLDRGERLPREVRTERRRVWVRLD